jgi:hypothetical protein
VEVHRFIPEQGVGFALHDGLRDLDYLQEAQADFFLKI